MKKILLLLIIASMTYMEANSQVFKLHNVPSQIFRKEGGSQINIDIKFDMPTSSGASVFFGLIGRSFDAMPTTDFENFSHPLLDKVDFPANDSIERFTMTPKLDGVVEGNDTFVFKITAANMPSGATIGTPDSVIIIIGDSTAAPITGRPVYEIGNIRGANNGNGSSGKGTPDSVGKTCTIRGTLHGVNRRTEGYNMSICDGTGCIGLFSGKTYSLYPSADADEGDSVEISGYINEFRGRGQIEFHSTGDTIRLLGNRPIREPELVTSLDENSESKLVKMEGLVLSSGTWLADTSFNLTMKKASGGSDQFNIRIENKPSTNFSAMVQIKPNEIYTITGIGSQFDQAPSGTDKTKGYQLLPRRLTDIVKTGDVDTSGGGGGGSSILGSTKQGFTVFPTRFTNSINLEFESHTSETGDIEIIDLQGRTIKSININIHIGKNEFSVQGLSNLPVGNYFVSLKTPSMHRVITTEKTN